MSKKKKLRKKGKIARGTKHKNKYEKFSKIILFSLMLCLMLVSFSHLASAQQETLGTFKQYTNVTLQQTCNNCTYNNISYIAYPNSTIFLENQAMTKSGVSYTYVLTTEQTAILGRYVVCGFGDNDGNVITWCYDFYINATGREEPEGNITVLFIVGFLIILGLLTWTMIYSFGHAIKTDFDMIDLAFDWGVWFALLGFFILQGQYLGNPVMDSITEVLIYVGGVTHLFAPLIFLFISMMRAGMEKKNFVTSGGWNG